MWGLTEVIQKEPVVLEEEAGEEAPRGGDNKECSRSPEAFRSSKARARKVRHDELSEAATVERATISEFREASPPRATGWMTDAKPEVHDSPDVPMNTPHRPLTGWLIGTEGDVAPAESARDEDKSARTKPQQSSPVSAYQVESFSERGAGSASAESKAETADRAESKILNQLRALMRRGAGGRTWPKQLTNLREQAKRMAKTDFEASRYLAAMAKVITQEGTHESKVEEAAACFEEAVELRPGPTEDGGDVSSRAPAEDNYGEMKKAEGKILNQLRSLLDQGSGDRSWSKQLGALREKAKRMAKTDFEASRYLAAMAKVLTQEGTHESKVEEASTFLEEAIELRPARPQEGGREALGVADTAAKHGDPAREEEEVLSFSPQARAPEQKKFTRAEEDVLSFSPEGQARVARSPASGMPAQLEEGQSHSEDHKSDGGGGKSKKSNGDRQSSKSKGGASESGEGDAAEGKLLGQLRTLLQRGAGGATWPKQLTELREQAKQMATSDVVASRYLAAIAQVIAKEGTHKGKAEEASTCYEDAFALRPGNLELAFRLGNTLYRARKFKQAVATYKKALAEFHAAGKGGDTADDAVSSPGDPRKAGGEPEKAPIEARVVVNMGVALEGLGKVQEAVEQYKVAINLHRAYPAALKLLGSALMELEQHDEAEQMLSEAVKLQPKFADAWSDLGVVRRKISDHWGALEALDRAVELNPSHDIALWNRSHAERDCGKYKRALKSCEGLLEQQADLWAAHAHRAILFTVLGDHAAAKRELKLALRKSGGSTTELWETVESLMQEEGDRAGRPARSEADENTQEDLRAALAELRQVLFPRANFRSALKSAAAKVRGSWDPRGGSKGNAADAHLRKSLSSLQHDKEAEAAATRELEKQRAETKTQTEAQRQAARMAKAAKVEAAKAAKVEAAKTAAAKAKAAKAEAATAEESSQSGAARHGKARHSTEGTSQVPRKSRPTASSTSPGAACDLHEVQEGNDEMEETGSAGPGPWKAQRSEPTARAKREGKRSEEEEEEEEAIEVIQDAAPAHSQARRRRPEGSRRDGAHAASSHDDALEVEELREERGAAQRGHEGGGSSKLSQSGPAETLPKRRSLTWDDWDSEKDDDQEPDGPRVPASWSAMESGRPPPTGAPANDLEGQAMFARRYAGPRGTVQIAAPVVPSQHSTGMNIRQSTKHRNLI
ncbi:hypothetical protein CYMTET_9988 [Cymbomonas tetramitiformis]|uniref:Uncharacterized protein n=1 Tax=Cymbomonas tetramitiformis TaxID=36881 RepID=A0AAE0GPY2_9CHLO|nr:hypothetical protein CYMTET_9988 [Cymbomonas tetramitiformis]